MSTATYDATLSSSELRYNEQRAFITQGRIPNYEDSMIGKSGYARYRNNEDRWYFREEGQDDYIWVHFRQICFVPMVGDKIVSDSSSVPSEYRVSVHAHLSDDEIRARTITVSNVAWVVGTDPTQGSVVITGEVKSLQKPDDTEEVKIPERNSVRPLLWRFLGASVGDLDLHNRHRTFHEFLSMHQRLETARTERGNWQSDVDLFADMIREEAENRGWCDEYDTFVDHYNNKSKVAWIDPRTKDYEVDVTIDFVVRVTTSVMTEARNEDDARDNVLNMGLGDFDIDLHDSITSHNYDVTDENIVEVSNASEC